MPKYTSQGFGGIAIDIEIDAEPLPEYDNIYATIQDDKGSVVLSGYINKEKENPMAQLVGENFQVQVENNLDDNLDDIVGKDIEELLVAEKSYGHSWRKRGGVGAFMMLARKWDRLENQCKEKNFDIFAAIMEDENGLQTVDGVIDDVRDLRRYLLLVEEYLTNGQHGWRDLLPKPKINEPVDCIDDGGNKGVDAPLNPCKNREHG